MPLLRQPMSHLAKNLRLAPSVFFRKVAPEVYVRDVATGEEFIFSAEAAPVFSALRRGVALDSPVLRENASFLRQLASWGLLTPHPALRGRKCPPADPAGVPASGGDLLARFQESCRRRHRLGAACLELTYRCNARCSHCYLDDASEQTAAGELDGAEWRNVIDQLARMGCMRVLVTGGEPTLHSDCLDICRHVVRRGMLCDLYTNGIAVPEAFFEGISALPLNSVSVSLYSGTDAFHDAITGIPGSFQKTLASLLRFKAAGFDVFAKTPLFHGHLDDYFSARRLGLQHNFSVHPANILVPGHSGTSRNEMMLDSAEYREFLERDARPDTAPETETSRETIAGDSVCHAGLSTLCISPTGIVRPCNSFPWDCGNVRSDSLSHIWKTAEPFRRLRALRRRDLSPACATCPDIACCTVCPGAAWTENPGAFSPCSWSCAQAADRAAFNRQQPIPKPSIKEPK